MLVQQHKKQSLIIINLKLKLYEQNAPLNQAAHFLYYDVGFRLNVKFLGSALFLGKATAWLGHRRFVLPINS